MYTKARRQKPERRTEGRLLPDKHIPLPTEEDLLFLPLGGVGKIGMNSCLYGTNKQWIMVDVGITFNDEGKGIEYTTPNFDILLKSRVNKYLKGVIITHAHEDHIGGVHEVWPHFKFHIYLTRFAKEVLLEKLRDKPYFDEMKDFYIHEVPRNGRFKVGHFDIEFFEITHSIPETNAVLIRTPLGNVLHITDWKIDANPMMGQPFNEDRFNKLTSIPIMAMMCDSTNIFGKGESGSEKDVYDNFCELFKGEKNRIVVGCFASNINRIFSIYKAGQKHNRKICLLGRSLYRMVEAAKRAGYPIGLEQFVSEDEALRLPRHQILYVATGTQGDMHSAIARISRGIHKLNLEVDDVVYISAKNIPGNESRITLMINGLIQKGIRVVTENHTHIHVSGHPCQDELKRMYEIVRPEYIVPIHGDLIHVMAHKQFAEDCGYASLAGENGSLISLARRQLIRQYQIGHWGYDGNRLIEMEAPFIEERQLMGSHGCIFATLTMDKAQKKLVKELCHFSVHGIEDKGLTKRIMNGVWMLFANTSPQHMSSETNRTLRTHERIALIVKTAMNKQPRIVIHWMYR